MRQQRRGHGICDETTDTFTPVTAGDARGFPSLYPGMHLLPSTTILCSQTGWASAGACGGASTDSQSAYFSFTGPDTGVWQDIAPATATTPNRAKGMSVLLHSSTPPYVRAMVIGGVDATTNGTYEMLDASILSPAVNWGAPNSFPDGQHRVQVVLVRPMAVTHQTGIPTTSPRGTTISVSRRIAREP